MDCQEKYGAVCMRHGCVAEAKGRAQQRSSESSNEEAGSESARLDKKIEAISPNEKEQEGEVAISREEMHSRSKPIKGNITYRC